MLVAKKKHFLQKQANSLRNGKILSDHFIYYKQQRVIQPLIDCNFQQYIHDTLLECVKLALQYFSRCGPTQGGSVAEWSGLVACWTQAQNSPGSNRSRDAVG